MQTNSSVFTYRQVSLDQLWKRASWWLGHRTQEGRGTHLTRVAEQLIDQLWRRCGGDVIRGHMILPQETLGTQCGIGRRWTHELLCRLRALDLIRFDSERLSDGTCGPTRYWAGNKLKHLFIELAQRTGLRQKSVANTALHSASHSSPNKRVKNLQTPASDKAREFCERHPTLKRWLAMGSEHG